MKFTSFLWLIEKADQSHTYIDLDGNFTDDPHKARRYATKELALIAASAYKIARVMTLEQPPPLKVMEHGFEEDDGVGICIACLEGEHEDCLAGCVGCVCGKRAAP